MSGEFSVGVEEEYQLVDPDTGELRSRAAEVLRGPWAGDLQPEMQQTMLEVGTAVCRNSGEVRAELARLRFQAALAAEASGLAVVAAGLHPRDAATRQRRSPGARYARLAERLGRVARTDHIFGMHVHVGIPEPVDRLRLITSLRVYLPHLLALSASSPLYAGEETGFVSYRTVLAGRLPNSGMPPALASEEEFRALVRVALDAGVLPDEASLYWSLRPHSRYPTLEFRVCDVCPRLDDAAALAGLIRVLVAAAEARLLDRGWRLGPGATDALLRANEWQASRFGLRAVLASPERPDGECLGDAVRRLLERVQPVAEALGEGDALSGVARILERGSAAEEILALHARRIPLRRLVGWLAAETALGTGMDRRSLQRDGAGGRRGRAPLPGS